MEWKEHDRWAAKLNVSKETSREVNTIIDAVEQGENVPVEYERHIEKCAEKACKDSPNSAFGAVAANYTKRTHDGDRGNETSNELSAEINKCVMKRMGEKYLKAWHLHHHLDVIDENRNSGRNFEEILSLHREEEPQTYSKTIAEFLRNHRDDLPDLG